MNTQTTTTTAGSPTPGSVTTDISKVNDFIMALSELTGDYTMPSQQQLLLLSLYVHGTLNQATLEIVTGVKRSSNSRNISKLGRGEKAWADDGPKLLESYEDLMDRRNKLVRLTPKGHAIIQRAWERAFSPSTLTTTNR